jgi:hypothetical protein
MKTKYGRLVILALALALVIASGAFGSGQANTGTFCSPQAAFHSEHAWGLPSSITFASGPQRVDSATLYLVDEDGVVYALAASGIARIKGTNHWTANVDFDVPAGRYWSYLWIYNTQIGQCGFKYGTIDVVETFE